MGMLGRVVIPSIFLLWYNPHLSIHPSAINSDHTQNCSLTLGLLNVKPIEVGNGTIIKPQVATLLVKYIKSIVKICVHVNLMCLGQEC